MLPSELAQAGGWRAAGLLYANILFAGQKAGLQKDSYYAWRVSKTTQRLSSKLAHGLRRGGWGWGGRSPPPPFFDLFFLCCFGTRRDKGLAGTAKIVVVFRTSRRGSNSSPNLPTRQRTCKTRLWIFCFFPKALHGLSFQLRAVLKQLHGRLGVLPRALKGEMR